MVLDDNKIKILKGIVPNSNQKNEKESPEATFENAVLLKNNMIKSLIKR